MRMILLAAILLSGCASLVDIDYSNPPPKDWPKLEERITYGTIDEVQRWCNMPQALKGKAFNCATVNFQHGLCLIYLSDTKALEHEREHCRGYDHVGDKNRSRNAWERWKSINSR